MNATRWLWILWLTLAPAAWAQRDPTIGYVYPAGGQIGTNSTVTVGGQRLVSVTGAFISGEGVTATIIETPPQLNGKQIQELRDELDKLREKRAASRRGRGSTNDTEVVVWTAENGKRLDELNLIMAKIDRRRVMPSLADQVVMKIAIAPDAKPGVRDLRLVTESGLSNPLVFCVGRLPETHEPAPKDPDERLRRNAKQYGQPGPSDTPQTETAITIPSVVNGQIQPGDVDRFRFNARKGTRLVATVQARELIPYLADAVPGWFQATLALFDADGKRLAYADDYRFSPDPALYCQIPADGEYVVEIRDSIYRGREDFVYRLQIGELPFLTGIFPLGGPAESEITVALRGLNLPVASLTMNTRGKLPSTYPMSVRGPFADSNPVSFAVDQLPECMETAAHDQPKTAQPLKAPVIVNGQIGKPGECDVYRVDGKAGETIVAEVQARRLGSPLDSYLRLTDARGKQLAFNDDHEDKSTGLNTHHADAYLEMSLPADGAYYLFLGDTQGKGGAEYAYRLRVSPPRPDFALRVVPSGLRVRPGGSVQCTVHVFRRDGYAGEVKLSIKDAPSGFKITGGTIKAGEDKATITLAVPAQPHDAPVAIQLVGQATINGEELTRAVVPADDLMQAFIYRHLVPAREFIVVVGETPRRGRN
jgi:hypothetical protein